MYSFETLNLGMVIFPEVYQVVFGTVENRLNLAFRSRI